MGVSEPLSRPRADTPWLVCPTSPPLGPTACSGCDVWIGKRPVLELTRVFALEPERLRIVALEQCDKERKGQEMVGAKLKELNIVVSGQRLSLFVGECLPRALLHLGEIQNDVGSLRLPPGHRSTRIFAVALDQYWIAVNRKEKLVQQIFAHAATPFGYQVK